MDPNANLVEQRRLAGFIKTEMERDEPNLKAVQEASERLAELVEALDEWLANGGFLPQEWQAGR